jgi:hypothetical protein
MNTIFWFFTLFCATSFSCTMKERVKPLPGKIAFQTFEDVCIMYEDSDTAKLRFKFRNDSEGSYSGFTWLNKQDLFVGSEYVRGKDLSVYKANIAVFDLHGRLIERFYEARPGETAARSYPSRSDKYLLFTVDTAEDYKKNPLEGLMRMNSIVIMDLQKKQVITVFKDVGIIPSFEIFESPWLYDESKFIYDISRENGIANVNTAGNDSSGIYACDISDGQRKLLIPGARFGICSPTSMKIAYIKDQSIWIRNLETNKDSRIYKASTNEKFQSIHWTPDGKSIYLANYKDYMFDFFTADEKLIDIRSGESLPFKKTGIGFQIYSWK